jgi:hypothetical protein
MNRRTEKLHMKFGLKAFNKREILEDQGIDGAVTLK